MTHKIFGIYDAKAEAIVKWFFERTVPLAARAFEDAVRAEGSPFGAHAEDFVLYQVGEGDELSCEVKGVARMEVAKAVDYVSRELHVVDGGK